MDSEIKKTPTSELARISLACGILSFFPYQIGMLCGIAAILFGLAALIQIQIKKGQYKGQGLAILSIILGILGPILVTFLPIYLGHVHDSF